VNRSRLFFMALICFSPFFVMADIAYGQQEILPKGIGLYRFGYRSFVEQTHRYNGAGDLEELGNPFQRDFSGQGLLQGLGGSELQKLGEEVAKFDSLFNTPNSLINQIDFGSLRGDVRAEVDARIFALAFGLSRNITIFMGAPYVSASVDTELKFTSGKGGASEVKSELGGLAFEQLQNGLDQASVMTTQTIKDSIISKGFEPFEHWEYEGIGDIRIGTIWNTTSRLTGRTRSLFDFKTTVNIPTGYVEQPDLLTDINIGKGYWSLINEISEKLVFNKSWWLGVRAGYGHNFDASLMKRVPEATEKTPGQDRISDVIINPGADTQVGAMAGLNLGILKTKYSIGSKFHGEDSYSGNLGGNYEPLGENSKSSQIYSELSVKVQTTELYQAKKFAIPMIIEGKYLSTIMATNSKDERYFELSLSSFFSTPMAVESKKPKKRSRRIRGYRSASSR
jgi:hypothetical protein